MKKISGIKLSGKSIKLSILVLSALLVTGSAWAEFTPEKVHFLIPGGAGGGWDGTARGVGKALVDSGILKHASFENMSGGGGGKALNHLISTARRQHGTMMVNSTPIIIRSLQGIFPQSFRDTTPLAAVIADYAAFVVPAKSKYRSWKEIIATSKKIPSP